MKVELNGEGREYLNGLIQEYNINDGVELGDDDDTIKSILTTLLSMDELPDGDKARVYRIYYRLFEKEDEAEFKITTPWRRGGR